MKARLDWPASKVSGQLAQNEAHVWAWGLDPLPADLTSCVALLDAAEKQRMQRFHFPHDQARYAVAHANLRRILSGYLDQAPESIVFVSGSHGKPELAESSPALRFNLSHSKTVAALGVVRAGSVGLDVEDIRPIEAEVAASHFSQAELAQLNALEGEEWLQGFYRCWTRKEAILKAEGVGLHLALDKFDVSLSPGAPAALLSTRTPFSHAWSLYDVSPSAATAGALATAHSCDRISLLTLADENACVRSTKIGER